ncbi:hypothetical protein EJ08DRAFT_737947 [Tothia fuscella]|uniref:SnoaL-like domain-containing protein n=1 Tax=Tothia fuscella TaxID=1048955 RepID=A0A9P4NHV3_9PEZI|nr:hypothetical protein EJ08DRAFT_737947 [Tothia fuscella]
MSSSRAATVHKFIEAFSKLEFDTISSLVSPKFKYTFAPVSAFLPPPMTLPTWSTHMSKLRPLLEAYPITIRTLIDCGDSENKVVIHATGQAQFKDAVMDDRLSEEGWVHVGEYVVVFTMGEEGLLDGVFEFADSKGVERFVELMKRAGGNLGEDMGSQG